MQPPPRIKGQEAVGVRVPRGKERAPALSPPPPPARRAGGRRREGETPLLGRLSAAPARSLSPPLQCPFLTIRIRISFLENSRANSLVKVSPIF